MTSPRGKDSKMTVNGPIYFLIQEQAKSIVAIQALQTRMAVLESLQERLMLAIDEVNHHIASSKSAFRRDGLLKTAGQSDVFKTTSLPNEKKTKVIDGKSDGYCLLSKSDSLNKDSGIGDSSLPPAERNFLRDECDDELLQLLNLIDQKSLGLLKEIEGNTVSEVKSGQVMGEAPSSRLLDNLLFEKVDTQRQLSEVKAERDELSHRLAKLELATQAVTEQKLKVQKQLDKSLHENLSLQQKLRTGEIKTKADSLGYLEDIERSNVRRKYLEYSEKSRKKVSCILKENNVLELQKQLLTFVMESDILRAKLQQNESTKITASFKIESQLRKELKEMTEKNNRLHEMMQAKDLEIASLKDKIRCFEEGSETDSCIRNFGMASTEDWRDPGNVYNKNSNLNVISPFSPLRYGDFSKTQSLPAIQLDAMAKLKEKDTLRDNYCHMYDTSSFTDVPLDQSYHSDLPVDNFNNSVDGKNLIGLTSPVRPNNSSIVTAQYLGQSSLQSGLSAPNLSVRCSQETLQNWRFAPRKCSETNQNVVGNRLINGHLCWKGVQGLSSSQDISSICTEFDPISEDPPSCENFVDSLNLSIPLKPTQAVVPQLSSIGDSLHSTSLELGYSSSPVTRQEPKKILNARSVDGIRDLLVDNIYGKRPSQYRPSPAMLSKSGFPVNLMNCTTEYSLM